MRPENKSKLLESQFELVIDAEGKEIGLPSYNKRVRVII